MTRRDVDALIDGVGFWSCLFGAIVLAWSVDARLGKLLIAVLLLLLARIIVATS